MFKEQKEFETLLSFRNHITQKDNQFKLLLEDNFSSFVGGKWIDVFINDGILDVHILHRNKKKSCFLCISSKTMNKFKKKTFVTPVHLPMIVKPKEHSKDNLGGYLSNNILFIEEFILKRPDSKTIVQDQNCVYQAVNGLSSTPFKVNRDVLDFLLHSKDGFFNEQLVLDNVDNKPNLNWRDRQKYKSLLSLKILTIFLVLHIVIKIYLLFLFLLNWILEEEYTFFHIISTFSRMKWLHHCCYSLNLVR